MSTHERISAPRSLRSAVGQDRALSACHAAVVAALAAGADDASAFLAGRSAGYTRFAEDRVHQPQDITEWTLMVRAEVDGRASRVATTDLEAAAVIGQRAGGRARSLASAFGALPTPAGVATAPSTDDGDELWREDTAHWGTAARTDAARTTMVEATRAGGAAYGMYGQAATELAAVTGQGAARYAHGTEAYGSLTVKIGGRNVALDGPGPFPGRARPRRRGIAHRARGAGRAAPGGPSTGKIRRRARRPSHRRPIGGHRGIRLHRRRGR